jgi:hypothetical protein
MLGDALCNSVPFDFVIQLSERVKELLRIKSGL